MRHVLTILGLSFGGLDVFAKLKAAVAWLAISIALFSGGYVWGRIDGASIAAHRVERANSEVRDADTERAFSDDAFSRAEIIETAAADNHNEPIDAKLSASEPHDRNLCLSGEWLRGLDALK